MRPVVRRPRKGLALPTLLVAASLVLAGCGGGSEGDTSAAGGTSEPPVQQSEQATLVDVARVDDLGERFNADAGHTRLLLILSPT